MKRAHSDNPTSKELLQEVIGKIQSSIETIESIPIVPESNPQPTMKAVCGCEWSICDHIIQHVADQCKGKGKGHLIGATLTQNMWTHAGYAVGQNAHQSNAIKPTEVKVPRVTTPCGFIPDDPHSQCSVPGSAFEQPSVALPEMKVTQNGEEEMHERFHELNKPKLKICSECAQHMSQFEQECIDTMDSIMASNAMLWTEMGKFKNFNYHATYGIRREFATLKSGLKQVVQVHAQRMKETAAMLGDVVKAMDEGR